MDLQSKLKFAINHILNSGDASHLESLLDSRPEVLTKNSGDYPDFHRIEDVRIGSKSYRICRQISTGETLTVFSIEEALETPGVPIWLKGGKLQAWAKIEKENPSDEQTD